MTYDINTVSAIVTGIGVCILEELATTPESGGVPPKMRTCLMVPGNIAWDSCECGQLAQTVQRIYPTTRFPVDSSSEPRRPGCELSSIAVQVLVSITRCVTGLGSALPPKIPTCAQLLADALIQQADAFAVRKAVVCCLTDLRAVTPFRQVTDYVVSGTSFVGPEGGCAGSELTYTFQLL